MPRRHDDPLHLESLLAGRDPLDPRALAKSTRSPRPSAGWRRLRRGEAG